MFPKVLIVSHNVFSDTSSMGKTLANFFRNWPSEFIAQLYFHSEVPTTDICKRYFRVTDFDLLLPTKDNSGDILTGKDIRKDLVSQRIDTGIHRKIYQLGRKSKPYMFIGRNLLWATNRWKTKKLNDWLDAFHPDVIFFASGDFLFAYWVAIYISNYKKIPIITYICDDYYFLKRMSISPFYYLNRIQYRKFLRKFLSMNRDIICICSQMSRDYSDEFQLNATTIMTSSQLSPLGEEQQEKSKIVLSYIGGLGLNRVSSLVEIGKALQEISGGKLLLNVYSGERRNEVIRKLTRENGIDFQGPLNSMEVIATMERSTILIHVESFDSINRKRVKYSVSTKIADSLASGRCLFAYGPEEVASIQHLIKNDCACVATKKTELKQKLKSILYHEEERAYYSNHALETVGKYHNMQTNSKKLQEAIMQTISRYSGIKQ